MEITQQHLVTLVNFVRHGYSDWEDFTHDGFVKDEITYKRNAVALTKDRLSRGVVDELIRNRAFEDLKDRVREIARATNLLWMRNPSVGDTALLEAGVDPEALAVNLRQLLFGEAPSHERLGDFSKWVDAQGVPNKWTFPTYLLFLVHPEEDFFVKPKYAKRTLQDLGLEDLWVQQPSSDAYLDIKNMAHALLDKLKPYGATDMVDVQSFAWAAAWGALQEAKRVVSAERRQQFGDLVDEFVPDYLATDTAQRLIPLYAESRRAAQQNFNALREARDAGRDITEAALLHLLPYTDTENNRSRGAWVTWASAVTGNVKTWFERVKFVDSNEWPRVAKSLLDFVEQMVEDPESAEEVCEAFDASPESKGFAAGMLSPILSALAPDNYAVINSKTRTLLSWLTDYGYGTSLTDYPVASDDMFVASDELEDLLKRDDLPDLGPVDVLDLMSHWLVSIRKYPFGSVNYWKIAPGENAEFWNECREGGFIGLGWDELGDLTELTRADFDSRVSELRRIHPTWTKTALGQVWKLASSVVEDDRVVANRGTSKVLGIGTVVGPYYFAQGERYPHRRAVDWEDVEAKDVEQTGWKRTIVKLDPETFRAIAAQGSSSPPRIAEPGLGFEVGAGFTSKTFELLRMLLDDPSRDVYQARKEQFQQHVEHPVQRLLRSVRGALPPEIIQVMETEKSIFSRIPKNDYGRGGAWSHYWGAFYPIGGKRIRDAQLFVRLNPDSLWIGFSIGVNGVEQRQRFERNVRRDGSALVPHLDELQARGFILDHGELGAMPGPKADASVWVSASKPDNWTVYEALTEHEVVALQFGDLVERVRTTFQDLFPLFVFAASDTPLDDLEGIWPDDAPEQVHPVYTLEECARDVHFPKEQIERWVRALLRKRQVVFYGPPGTGKTYLARHVARHIVGGGNGLNELVQFHPSYAYEDFIQGIRPRTGEDGSLEYPVVGGRFYQFCKQARHRQGRSVLIIDEINRANLSRVFGELMYLLEYRDDGVHLAVNGESFSIPKEIYLIGTMNTADRSIALVDHALRRRFAFLSLYSDFKVLETFEYEDGFDPDGLIGILKQINEQIADPNYHIGPSFFLDARLGEHLETVWQTEIEPYLEEFFFDQPTKVEQWRWNKVKSECL